MFPKEASGAIAPNENTENFDAQNSEYDLGGDVCNDCTD
jgi:hypothetical protein